MSDTMGAHFSDFSNNYKIPGFIRFFLHIRLSTKKNPSNNLESISFYRF